MGNKIKCPHCSQELKTEEIEEYINENMNWKVEVDKCDKCGGIWLDKGELEKLDGLIKPVLVEFRKVPEAEEQIKRITCPKCLTSRTMEKVESDRDKKVTMDICPDCRGIWLDGGELEAIRQESIFALAVKALRWAFS